MASIVRTLELKAAPDTVWDALREWAAPHERLVRGFVVDTKMDGSDRLVTFFNGITVREVLVGLDEANRRLVWSVADGPYTHHNASAQVFPGADGGTRFVWIADVLPNDLADRMAAMMDRGLEAIRTTLDG
jgi:uncharacterized protein YndB with AHSA1/START domain